jgi:hypothetical protein
MMQITIHSREYELPSFVLTSVQLDKDIASEYASSTGDLSHMTITVRRTGVVFMMMFIIMKSYSMEIII